MSSGPIYTLVTTEEPILSERGSESDSRTSLSPSKNIYIRPADLSIFQLQKYVSMHQEHAVPWNGLASNFKFVRECPAYYRSERLPAFFPRQLSSQRQSALNTKHPFLHQFLVKYSQMISESAIRSIWTKGTSFGRAGLKKPKGTSTTKRNPSIQRGTEIWRTW